MQEPKKRRQYEVQVSEAKCKICNQLNPASEFPKRATSSNGLNPHCKMCENQLQRERNQKRRERGPIERTVPERKKCSYCNKEKTKNDFGSNQYSKDGLTSKCKACTKAHIDSRDLSMRQAREESGNAKCTACKQKFPLTGFTQSKHDRRCRNCISKARADFMAGNAKEKLRMRVKSRIKNALKAASSPYQHKANREDQPITALIGCNFDELLLHIDPLLARFEDLRPYSISIVDPRPRRVLCWSFRLSPVSVLRFIEPAIDNPVNPATYKWKRLAEERETREIIACS